MGVVGHRIISRITGAKGVIRAIDRKSLHVCFDVGGSIPIPLDRYEEMLRVSEKTKEEIREFRNSPRRASSR